MRVLAAVLAAWMLIALSACSGTQDQPDSQPEPDVSEEPVQPDPPPPSPEELAAAQVEELLSSLTLEEQVGQLFFVRCPADRPWRISQPTIWGAMCSLPGTIRTIPAPG